MSLPETEKNIMKKLDETIKHIWENNAEPILITLRVEDYWILLSEATAMMTANYSTAIGANIQKYMGITVYKTMDTLQSHILAVKDGFLTVFVLKEIAK